MASAASDVVWFVLVPAADMPPPPPPDSPNAQMLTKLLTGVLTAKGSDLHLRAEAPPFARVDGHLNRANSPPLRAEDIEEMLEVASGRHPSTVQRSDWEFSFDHAGVGRFRGHAFRESGRWAVTFRVIPMAIPNFVDLRLPPVVKVLSEPTPGLVLITGPTGSGKTTTAASMLKFLAGAKPSHVVTIEDPIEYKIVEPKSCISQREVGRDTPSYAEGLKAVLREDPDIIFLGEIRDAGSLAVALQAAETGHSVLSTFHTGTATQTLQRLLGMFPPEDQLGARERLADALRGVLSQRLLPRKGARGRVLCTEVLLNSFTVKDCIRDPVKLKTLGSVLERSNDRNMHSLEQSLATLVREGLVDADIAASHAASPNDFRRSLGIAAA